MDAETKANITKELKKILYPQFSITVDARELFQILKKHFPNTKEEYLRDVVLSIAEHGNVGGEL